MDSFENIDQDLENIENKYQNIKLNVKPQKGSKYLNENMITLLQEFESLGLPEIKPDWPDRKLIDKIVINSHLLVGIHRRSLTHLNDKDLLGTSKDCKYTELEKRYLGLEAKNQKLEHQTSLLEASILRLRNDNNDLVKEITTHKEELNNVKRYYISRENTIQHALKKLENENQELKDRFGKDVGKYISRDDVISSYLKQCKTDEEMYKKTIAKLQDNNQELVAEVLNLRDENAELCARN